MLQWVSEWVNERVSSEWIKEYNLRVPCLLGVSQDDERFKGWQRRIWNSVPHLRCSFLAKFVKAWKPLTIFAKNSIVGVRLGYKYASEWYRLIFKGAPIFTLTSQWIRAFIWCMYGIMRADMKCSICYRSFVSYSIKPEC